MKAIKIVPSKFLKPVKELSIGETAWIRYESMVVDNEGTLFIYLWASTSPKKITKYNDEKGLGFLLEIERVEEGIIAYYAYKHYKWEFLVENIDMPAIKVVAKSDKQYEYRKRNPSQEDLEDQIDQRVFDLLKIENEFYGDENEGEKNFKNIALRAKKCQKEIDILVAKREEILEKKKRFRKQ